MGEGEFRALGNGAKRNLDPRLTGVLHASYPAPTHDDSLRSDHFDIGAAALVFGAVELAEADAIAPTDAHIGFGHQHRPLVRTPPLRNAFGRRDGIEDHLRPCFDSAHQRQARLRLSLRASASLASA